MHILQYQKYYDKIRQQLREQNEITHLHTPDPPKQNHINGGNGRAPDIHKYLQNGNQMHRKELETKLEQRRQEAKQEKLLSKQHSDELAAVYAIMEQAT